MSFVKLFSSITESSLWSQSKETRLLFVSMLARADSSGFVEAALPGLARMSNLSMEETQSALVELTSPDVHSKSKAESGRRIIEVEGGWCIVNYELYRSKRDDERKRNYMREYMRQRRQSEATLVSNKSNVDGGSPSCTDKPNIDRVSQLTAPTVSRQELTVSQKGKQLAQAEADAEADSLTSNSNTLSVEGGCGGMSSPQAPVLTFCCQGPVKEWALLQSEIDAWTKDYPHLDILKECRKAHAWLDVHTPKTARGMPRFLVAWFNRAADKGGNGKHANTGDWPEDSLMAHGYRPQAPTEDDLRRLREGMPNEHGPDADTGVES